MEKQLIIRLDKAEKCIVDLYKKLKGIPIVVPYTPAYQVISGTISTTGGGAVSINVQENTTGETVTFTRNTVGRYTITISGNRLTAKNCWFNITQNNNNQNIFYINYSSALGNTSNITVDAGKTDSSGYVDGSISSTPFEIRIYN